jgi:hypothetical protein
MASTVSTRLHPAPANLDASRHLSPAACADGVAAVRDAREKRFERTSRTVRTLGEALELDRGWLGGTFSI